MFLISAGHPPKWTTVIALVFAFINGSIEFDVILPESISTSANLTLAPFKTAEEAVAMNDLGVVINSSPSLKSIALYAASKDNVPFAAVSAFLRLKYSANSFSKALVTSPNHLFTNPG